jgi:alkylation response protein AidB-like acyl-CoA dehydrogenase
MTAAVGHFKTFLGVAPVWASGRPAQRKALAARVLRGERVALALTERAHGSDLAASDTFAERTPAGFVVSGEKWLINNARRGESLSLLARTRGASGPLSCSLFLVEKRRVPGGRLRALPKIRTHGIRGADISGVRLDRCPLPADSLIGAEGRGLECLLKSLQVTRALCAGLSLGVGDTALRSALGFSLERRIYGKTVYELGPARGLLTGAFLDLLAGECVSLVAARQLQSSPEQMSLSSAVVKYLVPTMIEDAIRDLSVVLGARFYLREGHDWGIFQKIVRDGALVGLFDGSTAVNLETVSCQLAQLARGRRERAIREKGPGAFRLGAELPELDWSRLSLSNRGQDGVTGRLPEIERRLASARGRGDGLRAAAAAARELRAALRLHDERVSRARGSLESSELARQECRLHAAAACLGVLAWNRESLSPGLASGAWAALCVERLLRGRIPPSGPLADEAAAAMLRMRAEGEAFSVLPLKLGGALE